ncbi:MAG: ABC transporter ATP-binding protein [Eggerthellaceae bacterium]|nr:ABC transporter ATP-binding protein [Eggerthellaceae bacterium]
MTHSNTDTTLSHSTDFKGTARALEAASLSLFWDDTAIVEDISLHVKAGEICCLVGTSGSGKTTILHALSGLKRPQSGRILLEGKDITGTPGHISYMLQKDLLLEHKRIIDNVTLPLVLAGTTKKQAVHEVEELFSLFGLEGAQNKWPHELSGGMRQRAALMRTYVMGNTCLLLDEPFSALDAITRTKMRAWFRDIAQQLKISALIITHDIDEAVSLAHRIYVLTGNPSAGTPSRISEEIVVPSHDTSDDFELSEAFLHAKRGVTDALNASDSSDTSLNF